MSTAPSGLSRRGFLAALAGGAAWAALGAGRALAQSAEPARTVVAVVESRRVIHRLQVKVHLLRDMVDQALMVLTGLPDPSSAWGRFVRPGQSILLQLPRLLGPELGTEGPMLRAVLASLTAAGHDTQRIRVAGLSRARYEPHLAPLPAGWSDHRVLVAGQPEQLRAYLDGVDAIVNRPVLADDADLAVGSALRTVGLPLIRRPALYAGSAAVGATLDLAGHPDVGGRVRLTLVNALRGLYDGGPWVDNTCAPEVGEVWASADMVAADRLAWSWLVAQRRARALPVPDEGDGLPPLLRQAGTRNLGQTDTRRILTRRESM